MVGIAVGARTCDVAKGEVGELVIAKLGLSHTHRQKKCLKNLVTFLEPNTHVIVVIISLDDDQS